MRRRGESRRRDGPARSAERARASKASATPRAHHAKRRAMRMLDRIGHTLVERHEARPELPDEGPAGRSTRPISARPATGSAQWCIDSVLTTRSNDPLATAGRVRLRTLDPTSVL